MSEDNPGEERTPEENAAQKVASEKVASEKVASEKVASEKRADEEESPEVKAFEDGSAEDGRAEEREPEDGATGDGAADDGPTATTLYELLGLSRDEADEVAKRVRATFSDSRTPGEWIVKLIEEFQIDQDRAFIFACGWFAGKYAGVSEVFSTLQKEMKKIEEASAQEKKAEARKAVRQHEKRKWQSHDPPLDGYA